MFITTLIIVVLIVALIGLNFKNKYMSVLILYLISITYLIFSAAVYISTISHYTFPVRADYLIYLKLSDIVVSPVRLSRAYNWGIALFFASSVYCCRKILNIGNARAVLLAVPILFFCIYSDPITARRIWVYQYYRLSENVEFFKNVIGIMNVLSKSLILVYTVMPFVCIVKFYKDTKFKVKKFHIKTFALCIFMIITFFYTVFIFGPFRSIMFYNVNPMGLPNGENIYNGYILVPSVSLIITSVMIILLMVFKPFNMFYFEYNKEKDIAKNTQMLTRNISIDLHFYKNMFWSVRQQFELIKAATNMGDYDSVTTYAANGINDIDKQLERLQNTINAMNNDFSLLEDIDIIQCIDSAIAKVKSAPNVSIIKDYDIKSIITVGNEYILTEAFFNLIKNASESFENMDIDDPVITVRIQVEDNVCMIEVSDNGCGIPKSELKYIFNPFYSTKVRTKNSGIGLNYVKEVIKSYHGTIEVISKVNQYTTFQITMPISKRKENSDE